MTKLQHAEAMCRASHRMCWQAALLVLLSAVCSLLLSSAAVCAIVVKSIFEVDLFR